MPHENAGVGAEAAGPARPRSQTNHPNQTPYPNPPVATNRASPLETERGGGRWPRRVRSTAVLLAVVMALWWAGRELAPRLLTIIAGIRGMHAAAPVAFILIYAVAVVALIPASLLTIAGGAVFGIARGAIYALLGATLGSTAAFLLGRHAFRRVVARRLASMPRFAAVERAVSAQGRRIVFLLRLSPVVPFNFLNYALGLTTISVWDFVIASTGTIPGAIVYAYAGHVTGEALALAGQAQVPKNASYYAILLGGLVATLAATFVVTRTARRALRDV